MSALPIDTHGDLWSANSRDVRHAKENLATWNYSRNRCASNSSLR